MCVPQRLTRRLMKLRTRSNQSENLIARKRTQTFDKPFDKRNTINNKSISMRVPSDNQRKIKIQSRPITTKRKMSVHVTAKGSRVTPAAAERWHSRSTSNPGISSTSLFEHYSLACGCRSYMLTIIFIKLLERYPSCGTLHVC